MATSLTSIGFRDMRTVAELLLAPKSPAARSFLSISSLKFGSVLPPVTGPLRASMGRVLSNAAVAKSLAGTFATIIADFDKLVVALYSGSFITSDPLFQSTSKVPGAKDFLSFSILKPGEKPPNTFKTVIEARKKQLQKLAHVFSVANIGASFKGVSVTENLTPTNYPHADQIDKPSLPALARGGADAQGDSILKDKVRFAVAGVPIGSGKPNFWTRMLSAAAIAKLPNLNSTVGRLFKDRKNQSAWSEPVTPYAAQYPYNKVTQTESGHVMEWDDTPGAERVHIFHRAGSFIEFHPDGSVVYKNMNDAYSIAMADQYVKVSGKCHIAVDGGATFYCKGDIDIQGESNLNIQTKGDFNVFAKNINLRAKDTFLGDGKKIDLRYLKLPSGIGFVTPMGGGPWFAARVNMTAFKADFPGGNFDAVAQRMAVAPLDSRAVTSAGVNLGQPTGVPPPETPLANPSVYTKTTPEAVEYRAKLFDTPEEVHDFDMYNSHLELVTALKDVTGTERQLGGSFTAANTGLAASAFHTKPSVNYLNFDNFKGKYRYQAETPVANTSFVYGDLVDLALHANIIENVSVVGSIEASPDDTSTNSQLPLPPGETPDDTPDETPAPPPPPTPPPPVGD
jgi:hypothetical protein